MPPAAGERPRSHRPSGPNPRLEFLRRFPVRYDELRIEHDQGDVKIVVYNRAILLFTTDSEAVRQIHRVCCRLA
jgi:hypothetical protein